MKTLEQQISRRRTFAIISHPDAGKTTLTEKFLLYGGAIQTAGSVKGKASDRHAVSDWMEMEKKRGISITSSVMQFEYEVEADHLDYFKDLAAVQTSFHKFAQLATGCVIANGDDPHTREAMAGIDCITFGLNPGNRVTAENMCPDWRHFDVICDGKFYCHLDMGVLGRHNALNALAAAGTAWVLGIDGEAVCRGLESFHGAGRRMEFKGNYNGALVYDDYAHHPDELAATIEAVRSMGDHRIVVAFQPHTYTRTHALFADFVRELKKADVVVLSEIYAARERNVLGISSKDLQQQIPGSVYCQTLPQVTEHLAAIARSGDVILTIGAGDIYRAGEALLQK